MRSLLVSLMSIAIAFTFLSSGAFAQTAPTFRDCSIASMSGSSQALLTVTNFNRKYLILCNTGATGDNVGVNLAGGTAALAGAGTMTLVPGSCKEFSTGSSYLPNPPANAINVIGTSTQPVLCIEGR